MNRSVRKLDELITNNAQHEVTVGRCIKEDPITQDVYDNREKQFSTFFPSGVSFRRNFPVQNQHRRFCKGLPTYYYYSMYSLFIITNN